MFKTNFNPKHLQHPLCDWVQLSRLHTKTGDKCFTTTLHERHVISNHSGSFACLTPDADPHPRNTKVRITEPLWGEFTGDQWIPLKVPVTRKIFTFHDDAIKWKHFSRYWPFARGFHRSPLNSPHKGKRLGALMVSLICIWTNDWVNNRDAGDLGRHHVHYDVTIMWWRHHECLFVHQFCNNCVTFLHLWTHLDNVCVRGCIPKCPKVKVFR